MSQHGIADAGERAPSTDHLKPWVNAQARCLLAGYQAVLTEADDGRPMVVDSRWALTRRFTDLDELDQWLTRARSARGHEPR